MRVHFSQFCFDSRNGLSHRSGALVALRPRTLAVLAHLVAHPHRLVSKDELLETVWGDVAVSPGILNTSIAEIRRALGDDAREPAIIQTVHRRGFRFVAALEACDDVLPGEEPALPVPFAPTACVGREDELLRLEGWLASARTGARVTAFVTGDMGVGKSSLLRRFVERQQGASVDVAWGQCVWFPDAAQRPEPYHPFLDAIDRLARSSTDDLVQRWLLRWAPSWTAQLPWLFGSAAGGSPASAARDASPARMLRELCVALEHLPSSRPLVMILEDLQWADPETVALIDVLATRTERTKLLMLPCYRHEDAARSGHAIAQLSDLLRHRSAIRHLEVRPLSGEGVAALLRERFALPSLPDHLVALVLDRSGGHPVRALAVCDELERTRTNGTFSGVDGSLGAAPRVDAAPRG